jgi:hypothetical protein
MIAREVAIVLREDAHSWANERLARALFVHVIDLDRAAVTNSHRAECAHNLAVVIASHDLNARSCERREDRLAGSRSHHLAVYGDFHDFTGNRLDIHHSLFHRHDGSSQTSNYLVSQMACAMQVQQGAQRRLGQCDSCSMQHRANHTSRRRLFAIEFHDVGGHQTSVKLQNPNDFRYFRADSRAEALLTANKDLDIE